MLQQIIIILCCAYTVLSIKILFIHNYGQGMLPHHRYEFILFPDYFITVVFYYRLIPSCFFTFSTSLLFYIFKFFHYWFLLFFYGIYNFISDQCFTCTYNVLYAIVCKIRLIMCSVNYVMQRINLNKDARSEA